MLEPQYKRNFDSTTDPNSPGHEPVHVALSTTMNSMHFAAHLKRAPWDARTSTLEIGSRYLAGSPTSTRAYTEVRASVRNMDDLNMPTATFRMWFLGLTLILGVSCLNTFLNFRFPAVHFMPSVIVLVAYSLGKALAYVLPTRTWTLPSILGGGKFTLNPGAFNVKEHVLIYMMVNTAGAPAYAMNTVVVAEAYYGLDFGPGFTILLVLATTLTGFGLARFFRKSLMWPADMVWPQYLVSCTLLNTLHEEDNMGRRRYRFFLYATTGVLLWAFFPSLLFLGMSYFSWVCWIAPGEWLFSKFEDGATNKYHHADNLIVNQLFGTVSGLGMGFITFDWSQISFIDSPRNGAVVGPNACICGVCAGVLDYTTPVLYYTNVSLLPSLPSRAYR